MTHVRRTGTGMTAQEIRELPLLVNLETAGRALGIGKSKAYQLVREGSFPVPIVKLGKVVKVPTSGLTALLGVAMSA